MIKNKLISITEFLTDDYYLGKSWKDKEGENCLFPFWKEQLAHMFTMDPEKQTKICHLSQQILLGGARGIGKTRILTKAIAPYYLYLLLNKYDSEYDLKNIAKDYLNTEDEKVTICFFNRIYKLAEEAKDSFCKVIEDSEWFRNKYGTIEKIYRNIDIIAANDVEELKGKGIIYCFMDEWSCLADITPNVIYQDIISMMLAKCKVNKMVFAVATSANAYGEKLKRNMNKCASDNPTKLHICSCLEPAIYEVRPDYLHTGANYCLFDVNLGNHKNGIPFNLCLHGSFKIAKINRLEATEFIIPQELLCKGQEYLERYLIEYIGLYPYMDFPKDIREDIAENSTYLNSSHIRNLKKLMNEYFEELDTLYTSRDSMYQKRYLSKDEWNDYTDKIEKIKKDFIRTIDNNIL